MGSGGGGRDRPARDVASREGPPGDGGRGLGPLLLLSAALVACALARGLTAGKLWLTQLLIVVALGQGVAAGLALPRFWGARGATGRPGAAGTAGAGMDGSEEAAALFRRLGGPGGRFLLFLVSVAFAAVEGHAVGAGLAAGAPPGALALLLPPLAIGALALRGAVSATGDG